MRNDMAKSREELMEVRKQMFAQMEQRLHESWSSEEDSLFYYHPSEDRIVLSHALFWTMSQALKGRIRQEEYLLLLRQYQEEMLDAYLQASKLAAIAVVAAGYDGDMDEELANELLDDMDFDRYGKVKCRAIEQLMPQLMKMVDGEMKGMVHGL